MITDFASLLYQQTRIAEEEGARVYEAVVGIVTDIKDDQKLCRVRRCDSGGPENIGVGKSGIGHAVASR